MTTNLLTFRPIGIRPSAASHRNPDPHRHCRPCWRPALPGYIIGAEPEAEAEPERRNSESDSGKKAMGSRFSPGCFTAEKARQLRIMTTKCNSFHDAMYHSAIASRLASDFSKSKN